jgi:hypothetical protein
MRIVLASVSLFLSLFLKEILNLLLNSKGKKYSFKGKNKTFTIRPSVLVNYSQGSFWCIVNKLTVLNKIKEQGCINWIN